MASLPCNSESEPAIIEQVITEFFAKSLHIILETRSPYVSSRNYSGDQISSSPSSSSSASNVLPRDKWFNLALRDCPAALENFDLWRQSNLDPLVVDIVLIRRQSSSPGVALPPPGGCLLRTLSSKERIANCCSAEQYEFGQDTKTEKIVERWIIQYESRKCDGIAKDSPACSKTGVGGGVASPSSAIPSSYKRTYKRSTILLRSLYVVVRLLPAYKVFRDLSSSGQLRPFSLAHRFSYFVEPFTCAEDAEMNQFCFAPVDTPCGRLCMSVSYIPTREDVSSESSTSLFTELIPDYVGSPTTDPLRRLPSLPLAGPLPNSASYTRWHSWSDDHGATPSVSPSPSPPLHQNPNPCLPPRINLPDNSSSACSVSRNAPTAHQKNRSLDNYWPSPTFSPSSSPSPPAHFSSGNLPNALLRCESAPVSIPSSKSGLPMLAVPPSPSPKGKATKLGNTGKLDVSRGEVCTGSASQNSSPNSRMQMRKDSLKSGELQSNIVLQKVLSFGQDDVCDLAGLKLSSCCSPRLSFSRSFNRLYFLNEFDDSEFACPFAVDDKAVTEVSHRIESLDVKGRVCEKLESGDLVPLRKSQDAAVGALVKMLRTAPPLHQDIFISARSSQPCEGQEFALGNPQVSMPDSGMIASGLSKSRTAADAFEELRNHKELRELLLKQCASHSSDGDLKAKSPGGST